MNKIIEKLDKSWTDHSVSLSLTPAIDTKNIFFYAQAAGDYEALRPYFTERAQLKSYLLLLTLDGKGRLFYQNREYNLRKGSLIFIDCELPHRYQNAGEGIWHFLWLHFNGATANGYYHLFREQNLSPLVNAEERPFFEERLSEILELNRHTTGQTTILTSRIITDLLTELLLLNAPPDLTFNKLPEHMRSLIRDIDYNFTDDIGLERYAQDYGLDKFYLSREFKKYFQINFKQYIISKRLNYAKDLLKFTDKSVGEIAEDCGYGNFSYFLALFKQHEGVTPLRFRKLWRQR